MGVIGLMGLPSALFFWLGAPKWEFFSLTGGDRCAILGAADSSGCELKRRVVVAGHCPRTP
jgi:hypothetical protein